jgi:hypothetical protein
MLYLLKAEPELLKVGYAADVERREKTIRFDSHLKPVSLYPQTMAVVRSVEGSRLEEGILHRKLAEWRLPETTEWYRDTPECREIINRFFDNPEKPKPRATMWCPNEQCGEEWSVAHAKDNAECMKATKSLCGLYRLSKRTTPPKAGPGRPKKTKP